MASDALPYENIGPYRLIERIGQGGMGSVFKAEQVEPVHRTVALKIVRAGTASEKVVQRFEAERQSLAVMDHPSIAKVLDAGSTDDGLPYFVMELVEGEPLTEYADAHALDLGERVELMAQICRAVQHAHAKGVIHRDLKPSNVLVSEVDGAPLCRVIDFGIARAVKPDAEEWARVTQADEFLGTPAYVSPEQLGIESDIDVRSDVYALGVLLYELLVGALPYTAETYRGVAAWAANLRSDTPTMARRFEALGAERDEIAARRGIQARVLARELAGELQWIVAKATRPDREDRYATANGLQMDLERYLGGHPVVAGPPSAAYRTRKFVQRHRWGVAAGAAGVVGLAIFGVTQAIQAEQISRARDIADARREQAESVLDFMLTDLPPKLEPVGRLDIMDDVGRQAVAYFAALPAEEFTEDELLLRSRALYQIGDVRVDQGDLPAADSAFRASLALADELWARDPADAERLFGVGQAEYYVGSVAFRRGDISEAHRHFERYLTLSEGLFLQDTTNLDWRMEVAYGHTNVGLTNLRLNRPEEAAMHMASSLEAKEFVVAASPPSVNRTYDLARGYFNLAQVQEDLGRLPEAMESLEEDIRLKRSILEEQPENATVLTTLADSENGAGRLLMALGELDRAEPYFRESFERVSALVRRDPENARWLRARGIAEGWVGAADLRRGRLRDAIQRYEAQVATLATATGLNREETQWGVELASAHVVLAEALRLAGDLEAARREAERGLKLLDSTVTDPTEARQALASAHLEMGRVMAKLGDDAAAAEHWTTAAAALEDWVDTSGTSDLGGLATYAEAVARLDQTARATAILDRLDALGFADPWVRDGIRDRIADATRDR